MDEQSVIFDYKSGYGRFLAIGLFTLFTSSVFICFITLVATIALGIVFLPDPAERTSKWQFVFPVLFFLLFGWTSFSGIRSWLWSLSLDSARLSLKTGWGKRLTVQQDEIREVQLHLHNITLQTERQTVVLYLARLPWKERIIFKTALFNWVPISTLPTDWQTVRYEAINPPETTPYAVEWRSVVHQYLLVNEMGLRYQKGKQEKTLDWLEIEAVSSEFDRKRFSFWVDSRRVQINYRGLNYEQLDNFYHALHKYLLKYKIPFEVRTFT